jgi:antitoxin (DNA-binding transcriptional repressor) of toxin-antitoxin stability system
MASVYTVQELKENIARVLEGITQSGRPALLTRGGRFVAVIAPVDDAEVVKAALSTGPIAEELARRAADPGLTYTSDQLLEELERKRP